jgi:hypothetical protein
MHPDQQALLRILKFSESQPNFEFNYDKATTSIWRDKKKEVVGDQFQEYETAYPNHPDQGLVVKLD